MSIMRRMREETAIDANCVLGFDLMSPKGDR